MRNRTVVARRVNNRASSQCKASKAMQPATTSDGHDGGDRKAEVPAAPAPNMVADISQSRLQIRRAEEHPEQHRDHERERPFAGAKSRKAIAGEPPQQDGERPGDAPDQEGPVRAMPEAGQAHHHDQHAGLSRERTFAAAERDVEIVADPGRQRDVPTLPEGLRRARKIRLAEIGCQPQPEQERDAERHVGIAGKIEIDLETEQPCADPCGERVWPGRRGKNYRQRARANPRASLS